MTIEEKIVHVTRLMLAHVNTYDEQRRADLKRQIHQLKAEIKAADH
ncbi:hypothetical protein [Anoxynatronum sibiricum]|uniref:Uncharacterized protein n=1 Tax=Anoxynatronum sibiricum TaxID=210623 RepID=A0ABU9VWC3_9CLOT